jgi:hypothetical protein
MPLSKEIQREWEGIRRFEEKISKKLFDYELPEGEAELLVGMLCMCQKYKEILECKVMQF